MIRLRVPRAAASEPSPLPTELRWDAPPATLGLLLSRRQFLRAAGIVAAVATLPLTRVQRAWARAHGGFFTRDERATLAALTDTVIPPDGDPGASALNVVRYVERLLTALDGRPHVFAGGPFSGRTPFGDDETGSESRRRPRNAFRRFTALTRLQDLVWRAELYGSATIPELAPLDAQLGGPKIGLRDIYRAGLVKVDQVARATHGTTYAGLGVAARDDVFRMLDAGAFAPDPRRGGATFIDLVIRHTLEGCFSVPEYGGNRRTAGWRMLGLEGDNQPLGFSVYSRLAGGYVERLDHPMSTPNPDEIGPGGTVVPRPLTADGAHIQQSILTLTAGFADGRV